MVDWNYLSKHEHWFTYLQFQTIWEESQLHIYIQSNKNILMDVQGSFRTRNTLNVATSSSKCCSAPPLKTHSKSSQHQQSQVKQTYKILKERAWQKKTSERDAQNKSEGKTWSKELHKVFSRDRIFRKPVISHRGKGGGNPEVEWVLKKKINNFYYHRNPNLTILRYDLIQQPLTLAHLTDVTFQRITVNEEPRFVAQSQHCSWYYRVADAQGPSARRNGVQVAIVNLG